jgi:2-polyprenyl-3-methyl-5-hydroxy-6-metoxy-1,4-benzoquinol methylase
LQTEPSHSISEQTAHVVVDGSWVMETKENKYGSDQGKPRVVDERADARFRRLVNSVGKDPDDPWIGGYFDYEWERARHIFETALASLEGAKVLEFGCNYGATSIVLATLGARVVGVDIDDFVVTVARENVARYGMSDRVELVAYEDTSRLSFSNATFDHVVCNGVLEYVGADSLRDVQREIDRVLRPGGLIFVAGTSNRLAPKEIHSGRWLINYLPQAFDAWTANPPHQRGVPPWRIRYGFGNYENLDWLDHGRAYLEARRRFQSPRDHRLLRIAHRCARCLGITFGLLTPSISVRLRKVSATVRTDQTHH